MHLTKAGGKRFSPNVYVVGVELWPTTYVRGRVQSRRGGGMTHLATLYHDDVMDEAQMRRGVPSANMRWSNSVAILSGGHSLGACL